MIVDTHTHLYLDEFGDEAGADSAVRRAVEAGVGMMILPNVDLSTIAPLRRLHNANPDVTRMAMGLHPTEVNDDMARQLAVTDAEFRQHRDDYVAVGEIGMDLYWDATFRDKQMEAFDRQCRLATELGLPVIIHCREALDPTLEVLQGHPGITGVMHSFGGTPKDADRVRRTADLYFGINGIVTFKNARLADTVAEIGLSRLLLETDAPYLAPVPHRGKRNESAYIVHTARHIAAILGCDYATVCDTTAANARSLFAL